jgi:3-deoxy-D-manno-octulosonic-acid transferase
MPWLLFYRLLYSPLLFLVSLFRFANKKLARGFKLRQNIDGKKPWLNFEPSSRPIWFHCSSGEFEYAKPVIREIKKKYPTQKILVSFFSPSVESSLKNSSEVDFSCPTPWDTLKNWSEFIEHHQPKALLIARTDLWPMMIHVSKSKGVPRLLFSKTVNTEKTESFFSKSLMKQLDDIFCVTEQDQNSLLKRLKPFSAIHHTGDTRYDQCLYRLQHGQSLKPLKNFLKPTFVAGSTWPSDERVLLPLIKEHIRQVSFIVAPHEPSESHLKALESQLQTGGLKFQRYTPTESWDPEAVLIIDQVGILADLYQWGQFAFIGGSMDRSVHSVMEPLAQGLLCFVGPRHQNNRESVVFQEMKIKDMTPVQVVHSSDELLRRFTALYSSWSEDHQFGLKVAVQQKAGASRIVLKWIENHCGL